MKIYLSCLVFFILQLFPLTLKAVSVSSFQQPNRMFDENNQPSTL